MKCILRPVAAGRDPARKSLKAGPVCVPPPFPLTYDVIAFSDEVRDAPEIEVRKGFAESGHEGFDVVTTTTGLMQRVFQQHVRRSDLVDNVEVTFLAPETGRQPCEVGLRRVGGECTSWSSF